MVAFGFAEALWLALACLVVAGAMDSVSGLFRSTMWNETIPEHLRGRLAGIEMLSWSSGPTLGGAEAGAVAALAGVRASVVSGGVLCVAGTAALVLALPRFWAYDARSPADTVPPPAHGPAPAPP
jgi:sugar phosphate permease